MTFDIVASGYPSIDHILPVSRAPQPGETGVILQPPRLDMPNLGGCVNNIAVAGARLGLKTTVVILVGDDADGKRVIAALNKQGVDTQFGVHVVPGGHTAHTFLFVDPGNRHQTFYFPGVSDREDVEIQLGVKSPGSARWGAITVGNARHNRAVLNWMVEYRVAVLWSHKNDVRAFPKDLVEYLAEVSEIVVLNHHEAQAVQQILGLVSISGLLDRGPRAVILTQGARGSRIITPERTTEVPAAPPKRLVDPTGAGDAFTTGVLFGLLGQMPLEICCRIGAVVASFALEAWGCQTSLPGLSDLLGRYQQVYGEDLQQYLDYGEMSL